MLKANKENASLAHQGKATTKVKDLGRSRPTQVPSHLNSVNSQLKKETDCVQSEEMKMIEEKKEMDKRIFENLSSELNKG